MASAQQWLNPDPSPSNIPLGMVPRCSIKREAQTSSARQPTRFWRRRLAARGRLRHAFLLHCQRPQRLLQQRHHRLLAALLVGQLEVIDEVVVGVDEHVQGELDLGGQ
eukprot:132961-Chlamydomonas_euryale.AAC.1